MNMFRQTQHDKVFRETLILSFMSYYLRLYTNL